MEKWSRGYAVVKVLVRYAFWLSHKRVVVVGRRNIPRDKPVIFAPNHQNALMDALSVLLTNHTQPVWLARADIFKNRRVRSILRFLKIIPVYRIRDGKENLDKNDETFAVSMKVLENKQVLALFPEAAHTGRRQMIGHKKAVPRIAFLTEEKHQFKLGVQIVPVGIYYSHYWNFNRSVIVQYGAPIDVASFKTAYEASEQQATRLLREEIYSRIKPLILHIESPEYYAVYEQIREIAGEQLARENHLCRNRLMNRFLSDKKLVETVETFEKTESEAFLHLVDEVRDFTSKAGQLGVRLDVVGNFSFRRMLKMAVQIVFSLVTMPVFVLGLLLNGLQFFLPRYMVAQKLKDPIFRSTFNLVLGLILFPVFHLLFAVLAGIFSHSLGVAVLSFVLMPLLGKLAYNLLGFYKNLLARTHFLYRLFVSRQQARNLIALKQTLLCKFSDIYAYQPEE